MPIIHTPRQASLGDGFDAAPRHRLFFAVWPDAGAVDQLTGLIGQLRDDRIMPGRPADPDRLHATLHHLGDFVDQVPPHLVPTARAAAATVKAHPFEVTFDRIVGTGERLLLLTSDRSAALRAFRQALSVSLIAAGLRQYIKPAFNPHVTLSYDSSNAPEQHVAPITWTVQQFALTESLLGQHKHVELDRWTIRS